MIRIALLTTLILMVASAAIAADDPFAVDAELIDELAEFDGSGDGILDLRVTNSIGEVTELYGYGDCTYRTAESYFAGEDTITVVILDHNEDGFDDILTIRLGEETLLLGNGDMSLQAAEVHEWHEGAIGETCEEMQEFGPEQNNRDFSCTCEQDDGGFTISIPSFSCTIGGGSVPQLGLYLLPMLFAARWLRRWV